MDEIVTVEADEKDEEEVANAVNVTVPVDDTVNVTDLVDDTVDVTVPVDDTAAVLLGVLAEDDDAL